MEKKGPLKELDITCEAIRSAYQDKDGYNYVFFIDNFTPGKLRVIRDKPGMPEVDNDYTTMETNSKDGEEHTIEPAYVLFTPNGAQAQYAICSPIVDEEGNIYFKNDSAQLMRLSSRITELEVTQQPDRTTYSKDDTFDAKGLKVTAHYANGATKDVSDYLKYTTDPLRLDDTEITIGINLEQLVKDKLENLPEGLKNQTAKWQQYQDKDGKAGVEWEMPTTTVTITVEEHHNYGGPTWTWNDDFTASAVFTCTDDDGHTQTVPAVVTDEVTTEPTCDKEGLRTYTAKVTFEGKDYTDTKTEPIPAKGHTLTAVAEVPATCETAGTSAHWKCDVCGKLFSDAEGKTETTLEKLAIPATGHAYGEPVWKWNDDFTASATFTCANDATHVKNVTAEVTSAVTTPAACETTGVRTYTAKVTFEGKEYTDTKTEVIPATSHDTELVGAKDVTCTEDGYTGDEVCKVCGVTVKQGEVLPALGHDYKDGKCSRCGAEEPTTPVEPGKPGDSGKPTTPEQPAEPSQPTTPATGDSSYMTALWVVLAVAGLGIIALVVLLVTKRSKKQNG